MTVRYAQIAYHADNLRAAAERAHRWQPVCDFDARWSNKEIIHHFAAVAAELGWTVAPAKTSDAPYLGDPDTL